jgi:hypothetical protein
VKAEVLASYEGEITDDEIINLIINFCETKRAEVRLEEYRKKVANPPKPEPVSAKQLYKIIINKALDDHRMKRIRFKLSEEEKLIYWLLCLYFTEDKEFEKRGLSLRKGLLIFGVTGCGKTTMMNLFRINPRLKFGVFACSKVSEAYKKEGVAALEKFYTQESICFDDLGTETYAKNFGNESNVMADILMTRYENECEKGFRTHITTNLTNEQVEEYYGKRVRSRMKEMYNVISFPENSTDKRK